MSDSPPVVDPTLQELAKRVDDALRSALDQDVGASRRAIELRDAVEAFHKEGLRRMLTVLRDHEHGDAILPEFAKDPFLQALFGLHGLIRQNLEDRIRLGLQQARPLLQQHNGDVRFVRREGDVVHVELLGSCTDCVLGPSTLREAVTDAVVKLAPEIKQVVLAEEAKPQKPIIEHPGEGWQRGPDLADLEDGVVLRFDLHQESVLIRRNGDQLKAWYNRCPHRRFALDGGLHDQEGCDASGRRQTITCPWHGWTFDVDSGECLNNKTGQPLVPVPLVERQGALWLRP
ncbi:MAG: NifU family protein [Planctomycetes bacterium]|nr:NifU family protein [Planctomycetota bacterium]